MKSLMIASLPKSLSTPTYRNSARAVSLYQPLPKHGEVFSLLDSALVKLYEYGDVKAVADHLRKYSENCIVKDVLAPQAVVQVADDFNVLVVQRPVADIVYLRLHRSPFPWEIRLVSDIEIQGTMPFLQAHRVELVDGVLRAQEMLRGAADQLCKYDDLVKDPEVLWGALEAMGYRAKRFNYADERWCNVAKARLSMRRSKEYKAIEALVEERRIR